MIQNKELFEQKKEIVNLSSNELIKSKINTYKYRVNTLYHGVPLSFHTNSNEFYLELKSYLPSSWSNEFDLEKSVDVYIKGFQEYGFNFDSWCNELSQDCIIEEDTIIQRDFVAKVLNEKLIHLITLETVCDGFYNFLRWYLPLELMKVNKLILHSSCILDNQDNAHFFLGHSGAGKTTITSLSGSRKILGDDMNLLSLNDNIYAQAGAIGGYFKPQVNYSEEFPIKSFNWIVQSNENRRIKLSIAEARSKIMASVSNIFWDSLSKAQTEFIFNTVLEASQKIPVYELHFKKESSFWDLIEKDLK